MEWKNLDVYVLTYNRAKFLKIMLESLCTQTATGFKIFVLDNASTDDTKEIVNTVAAENKTREIVFITCEQNTGNIGNFIKSQNLAKNKYTAVFHDDDAIHPEYIDIAMAELTRNPNAVMATGYGAAFFNVDNNNWDILFKGHLTYPPKFGPYFNLLIGRPTFACAGI